LVMAYPFNGVGDFEHHHLAMTAMQALLLKLPDTIPARTGRNAPKAVILRDGTTVSKRTFRLVQKSNRLCENLTQEDSGAA
ncbi:MAG: hypothetical protein JWM91_2245, partial [Rhodospirillales bacterium]|nr:hypothetical protein [Rhodospirillales bacterium]